MKQIFIGALVCLSFTLFSFTKSPNEGVTKIGERLYNVNVKSDFSDADHDFIKRSLQIAYGITDAKLTSSEGETLNNLTGKTFIVLDRTWIVIALMTQRFVISEYSAARVTNVDDDKLYSILEKYVTR